MSVTPRRRPARSGSVHFIDTALLERKAVDLLMVFLSNVVGLFNVGRAAGV